MKVEIRFGELNSAVKILQQAVNWCDLETGYKLRRNLRNISNAIKDVMAQFRLGYPNFDEYNQLTTSGKAEEANEKYPEMAAAMADLFEATVDVEIWFMRDTVLEKPWPMMGDSAKCPITAGQFAGALEALDLINFDE